MRNYIKKLWFYFTACGFFYLFSISVLSQEPNNTKVSKKTSIIVGYQIGGLGYLGANYEYKLNKTIGIHAGIGYTSYTGGFKFHINDCATCPFLNISFKDKGLGSLGTLGAEFASNIITFRKEAPLGVFVQFGYGYIVYLSEPQKNKMYGSKEPAEGTFTFGLGIKFH